MTINTDTTVPQMGIILYTDGGVRPRNPGPGGWGLHGYTYQNIEPKKGTGNPDIVLTNAGYVIKKEFDANKQKIKTEFPSIAVVTPVMYFDGYGSFDIDVTNNVAEFGGVINGIQLGLDTPNVNKIQIFTDSNYIVNNFDKNVDGWKKNNWCKSDFTPIANVPYWKELLALREQCNEKMILLTLTWVRSHTDELDGVPDIPGNIIADHLATVGVMRSLRQGEQGRCECFNEIKQSPPEKYWNTEVTKNPLIAQRSLYFSSVQKNQNSGVYFLGDHGKVDDILGKRVSDGAFSVVILDEPDEVIELVKDHQMSLVQEIESIFMIRLNQLYKPRVYKELQDYGSLAVSPIKPNKLDLITHDKQPLTKEFFPPIISSRAINSLEQLYQHLLNYLSSSRDYTATDITPLLYESVEKKSKKEVVTTTQLRAEYKPGVPSMIVKVGYTDNELLQTTPIALVFTIDLPDRNALKRLETCNPKVTVITWSVSPKVFKYAVVIEATVGVGIWAGVYSNVHFIKP